MTTQRTLTAGVHHVGLTVPDIAATSRFFIDSLGFRQVAEKPYPAIFLSDGVVLLTLWQAEASAASFDRKRNVGLHHLALQVADGATLDGLHDRLRECAGVEIEFSPEPLGAGATRHMMCEIPGGIRLELIAP